MQAAAGVLEKYLRVPARCAAAFTADRFLLAAAPDGPLPEGGANGTAPAIGRPPLS